MNPHNEVERRQFLSHVDDELGKLIDKAHKIGAIAEARHLRECRDKCGWELAEWLERNLKKARKLQNLARAKKAVANLTKESR